MKPSLEGLQIELIEHIVTFLELRSIASLRLTCRAIENKASQGYFATFFERKTVQLTTGALQDMLQVISKGRLGCRLRDCTLTGIAQKGTTTAADEAAKHTHLLAEALRNLKQLSPNSGLASLSLRVAVRVDSVPDGKLVEPADSPFSWRAVWDTAIYTFNTTMAALDKTQLSVEKHLDIFGSLTGCSLACHVLMDFAQNSVWTHIFGSLKKLTLSLSAPHHTAAVRNQPHGVMTTETNREIQSRYSTQVLQSIIQLSHIMPDLEILDLHWYNLGKGTSTSVPPTTDQESSTGSTSARITGTNVDTKCLKECSLRGIYTAELDLLQFLQSTHLETVTLTDVNLISGTYASIFDYLTDPDSPVTCYHLDDLREGNNLARGNGIVHFNVPGKSKYPYDGGQVGPSSLTRQKDNAREAIRYRLPPGRALGSGPRMRWRKEKAREFGTPLYAELIDMGERFQSTTGHHRYF